MVFTGESKLKTNGSSIINIYSTGYVTGSSASQKIKMGSSMVWKDNDAPISGLTSCDATNNCYTNAVLPVELLEGSFSVDKNEQILQTEWTTASEQNNEYFHIEYSTDYMVWKDAAIVMGAGNSNNDKHYSNSAYLECPEYQKDLYVRLSQVDFDGQRALLLEETVNIQNVEELEMNPNPASDYLIISGNSEVISALVVTNIQG